MIPTHPPIAIDFMLAPHARWFAGVDSAGVPDAVVDSSLNAIFQMAAKQHHILCKTLKRHDDIEHVKQAENWPIRHYDWQVGWFYWRECGPTMDVEHVRSR